MPLAGDLHLASLSTTAAPVKTWSGNSNGNWSIGANWIGNVAPVDGDNLLFPANATRFTATNDIAGLNFGQKSASSRRRLLHAR